MVYIRPSFSRYGTGINNLWFDTTNFPAPNRNNMSVLYNSTGDVGWTRGYFEFTKQDIENMGLSKYSIILGARIVADVVREGGSDWDDEISLYKVPPNVPRNANPFPPNSQLDKVSEFGNVVPIIDANLDVDVSDLVINFIDSGGEKLTLVLGLTSESGVNTDRKITLNNMRIEFESISPSPIYEPTKNEVVGKGTNPHKKIEWESLSLSNVSLLDVSDVEYSLGISRSYSADPIIGNFTQLKNSPNVITDTEYTHNFGLESEVLWSRAQLMLTTRFKYKGQVMPIMYSFSNEFTVDNRIAPTKPTHLSPANNENRDADAPITLSWQFNDGNIGDYPSRSTVRYKIIHNTKWREVNVGSRLESITLPARSMPLGDYEWQVMTRDSTGLESPWSDIAYFTASDIRNAPDILTPNEFTDEVRPIVTWHDLDQSHVQLTVAKANDPSTLLWDSEEVETNDNEMLVGVDLEDAETYIISLRIKRDDGLWSSWSTKQVTTDFSQATAPTLDLFELDYGIRLVVTGEAYRYSIYKFMDEGWIKVAVIDPEHSDMYTDLFVASGKEYEYRAGAETAGGNEAFSDVVTGQVTFNGAYIHSINDPDSLHLFKYGGNERVIERGIDHDYRQFTGREKPTIVYGTQQHKSVTTNLQIKIDSGDDVALERYLYNRSEVCYRDGRGLMIIGSFTEFPLNYEQWGWLSQITVIETDFVEGIE